MRFQTGNHLSSVVMSLLILSSGMIGFQLGQPSNDELERRIESLSEDIFRLDSQVGGLASFVDRDMSRIVLEQESRQLWVYVIISSTEYAGGDSDQICSGTTPLIPYNLGVSSTVSDPLVRPEFGIYTGTWSTTLSRGPSCIREYFFPNVPMASTLYFADWNIDHGLAMPLPSFYWERDWKEINPEEPFIFLST